MYEGEVESLAVYSLLYKENKDSDSALWTEVHVMHFIRNIKFHASLKFGSTSAGLLR